MSLTLEISPEIERQLREAAASEGREIADFVLEAARERARLRETQKQAERMARSDAALDRLTQISEDLGLYDHQNRR